MTVKVFAVFDVKVGAYQAPFVAGAVGQAVRMFGDAVQNRESPFNKHPEDYRLFLLGEFEDSTGRLTASEPQLISEAVAFVGGVQ